MTKAEGSVVFGAGVSGIIAGGGDGGIARSFGFAATSSIATLCTDGVEAGFDSNKLAILWGVVFRQ